MDKHKGFFLSIFLILFILNFINAKKDWPDLKGPYLGQKSPGTKAEIFAPGLISTKDKHDYFSDYPLFANFFIFMQKTPSQPYKIYITQIKDGKWTKPKITPFKDQPWYHNYKHAKPGKIIYFAWRGSLGGIDTANILNIWKVKKMTDRWSPPEKLPAPVNGISNNTWPSITKNFDLYFFSRREGGIGKCDIYRSGMINGKHSIVENLGNKINTEFHEADPYIAPDESYLLFCSNRPGGFGKLDIYISYKNPFGVWSKPINLGKFINTEGHDERPFVTSDRKYLFFTSNTSGNLDIYWVDAKIIEELKPENLK